MTDIRLLDENDLDAINNLQKNLGYREINKIPGCIFGYFSDGNLVGIIGIFPYERLPHKDYPNGKLAEIGALYVNDKYRNQGIATKLLQSAMDYSKKLKLDACVIDCTDMSYDIFKTAGFENSTEHRMWKVL